MKYNLLNLLNDPSLSGTYINWFGLMNKDKHKALTRYYVSLYCL